MGKRFSVVCVAVAGLQPDKPPPENTSNLVKCHRRVTAGSASGAVAHGAQRRLALGDRPFGAVLLGLRCKRRSAAEKVFHKDDFGAC